MNRSNLNSDARLKIRQMVVLAGGLGTRMESAGFSVPKAILPIRGRNLIEIISREAEIEGFDEILWCLGHRNEEIRNAINSVSATLPRIKFKIVVESRRMGTLGALVQAREHLHSFFCVVLGDLYLERTNIGGLFQKFIQSDFASMLLLKYSNHPHDSDLVEINDASNVQNFIASPHTQSSIIGSIGNSGIAFFRKEHIPITIDESLDLFKDHLVSLLHGQYLVCGVFHQGTIADIGTPERFKYQNSRTNTTLALTNKKSMLFDRDGTLNVENGHISSKNQIEIFPYTPRLLSLAAENFDKWGIITNQPVVARGEATFEDVIQATLEILKKSNLSSVKNFILKICPHHPDSGFINENSSLKIWCRCRKPEVSLFLEFLSENSIRATNCIYVGNSLVDIIAAQRLQMKWVHLKQKTTADECDGHAEISGGICVSGEELASLIQSRVLS